MRLFQMSRPADRKAFDAYCKARETRFPPAVIAKVSSIVSAVRKRGDSALVEYTRRYDGVRLSVSGMRVGKSGLRVAWDRLPARDKAAMRAAWSNILRFHLAQRPRGVRLRTGHGILRQVPVPIESVGIHVPAGRAPLVSTFLMVAGAARAAGVPRLAMFSAPRTMGRIAPAILAAAHLVGIDEVYSIGGAQGVAALVYGTRTVRPVDRVAGPGNAWVQCAKWLTQAGAGCEGASELLVLADRTAPARAVAADLLAQAEHTGNEYAVLVTDSPGFAARVRTELALQMRGFPRAREAGASLSRRGAVVLVRNMDEGARVANRFGAEHLEVICRGAGKVARKAMKSGCVLVGAHTPTAVEDYGAGPNHVLPTSGTSRYASGLGTRDFVRMVNVTAMTKRGLRMLAPHMARLARMEGLEAHARSVEVDRG